MGNAPEALGQCDFWDSRYLDRVRVFPAVQCLILKKPHMHSKFQVFTLSDLFCCFFFIYMMGIDSWTAHALNFGRILGSVFNQPTLSLLRIISRTFVNPPDVCKLFCSKLLESHTLHVCLCVCSLPHVRMHYRASRALVHLLAWVLTSLSSSNEHETRCDGRRTISMHYLTNGQVADALVLVLRPISQWAKTALFNHLIFSWVRSVMFTMIFFGYPPSS